MLADQTGEVLAVGPEGPHSRDLVFGHEAAVAHRVGTQDGGESANDSVGVHSMAWRSSEHQQTRAAVAGAGGGMAVLYLPPTPGGPARLS